jgi:TonB-dependent starch-binding outer membrane protein SusC
MKRSNLSRLAVLLLFCFMQLIVHAQETQITGKVLDTDGNSVPGVSILVKGTTSGTISDLDGNYSVKASSDAVLVFSFIGYATQEITVGGQSVIDVTLREDITELDEIVVTGYGVTKKSDLTGSLASLSEEDFNKGASNSPERMIQGKVAGVSIVSNNGEPGAGSQIKIRGASTIRSEQQPLYVVDGIPLDLKSTTPDGISGNSLGGAPSTNPLNFINPNDIEKIDILKDASAAAIYGSRGANGVIFITTKKGKEGQSRVEYSVTGSFSKLPHKLDVLTADEWVSYRADSLGITDYDYGASTDWQDQVFRNAYTHEHNLSLSGGTAQTAYRASFGYSNQEGIIKNSDLQRYTGRMNLTQKALNNKLVIEMNLTGSHVAELRPPVGATGFEGDLLLAALVGNPTWPTHDSLTGDIFQSAVSTERSPLAMLEYTTDKTRTSRILGGISGQLEIIKGLTFKVNLGLDYSNANRFINQSQRLNYQTSRSGTGQINNKELYNYVIENTLNYEKVFGQNKLTLLAGYSYQNLTERGNNATGGGYATDGIFYTNRIGAGTAAFTEISSWANPPTKMQSYFGRVNYNLMEKYLVTATVRADGSSKFGVNNRYGIFPSFAAGWRLSEEAFIKDLDLFSNLKLRAGWGKTGNSEIPGENSLPLYQTDDASRAIIGGQQIIGLRISRTANPDISWEATSSYNAGLDFGFFGGRLSGVIDGYYKTTQNLILEIPTLPGAPTSTVIKNIDSCKIVNKGLEVGLTGVPVAASDITWEISGIMTLQGNVVKNLPVDQYQTGSAQGQGLTGAYVQVITSNQPMNVFYVYMIDSIDQLGRVTYKVDTATGRYAREYVGQPQPKFTWSLTNTVTYKNFDLSIFIEGVHGNKIFNNTGLILDKRNITQARNVLARYMYDEIDPTLFVTRESNRYIEDGSYVRISNVSLGYNFKMNNKYMNSMRIYASVSNLFVFTKYTGYDPDVSSSKNLNNINSFGIDNTNYPKARTILVGLNVGF